MAIKFRSIEPQKPVALSTAQRAAMAAFVTSLGQTPADAVEVRVWWEAQDQAAKPGTGVLMAQVAIKKTLGTAELPIGAPLSAYEVVDE